MRSGELAALRRGLLSLLLGVVAGLPLAAQPAKSKEKEPASAFRLPSGAIIVVTNDPESIDKSASVYLTPEKYRELNDQIELLKKQVASEKPIAPSSCELDGRIETRGAQSIVRLRATFKFRTIQPRSVVALGCQKMQPVEAKLEEGKLPLLAASDKGLSVLIEDPGDHTLRLEMESALLPRGPKSNEIGFDIGLPGAAITLLSFAIPAKVQRVTLSRREVSAAPLFATPLVEGPLEVKRLDAERLQPGRGGEPLGPVTFLSLSWEDPSRVVSGMGERSAEADVQVTIGDADIVAEARLRLRGAAKEWRFIAPSNAEVTVGRAPATAGGKILDFPVDQAPDIVRPEPGQSIWRIRFRETSVNELLVGITTRATRNADPKLKSMSPVGPFAVLDMAQQSGAIRIKAPPHIKVVPTLKGDTQRLDTGDDASAELLFRYRSLPAGPNNQPTAPLELDIRAAIGVVQTRVHHHLQIGESGWQLRTEIAVVPIRMELESLDIEVPATVVFEAVTPKLVESISPVRESGPQRRIVRLKLAIAQRSDFVVALEGFYPVAGGAQEVSLLLPRVLNALDRMGQVTVATPEGFDLRGSAYQWETDKSGTQPFALEPVGGMEKPLLLTASVSRSIGRLDLGWKPRRSDLRVDSQLDIVIGDREAEVTHSLKYVFADRLQKKLHLHASAPVTELKVNPGSLKGSGPLDWSVDLPADPEKETTIVLKYKFPLPAMARDSVPMTVPVLWPDGPSWCENHVRIWRDRHAVHRILPSIAGNYWEVRPPEISPNEPSLSLLALHASGTNVPLDLQLIDPASGGSSDSGTAKLEPVVVWVDRTLIQAQANGSYHQYRARFHLSKWFARTFDVETPAGATDIQVNLNGLRVDPREKRPEDDALRLLRIVLPVWRDQFTAMVEIKYQLPAGRNEGFGSLISVWQPPRPSGRVVLSSIRWQVAVPSNMVTLSLGNSTFEEHWTIRNGIAQPTAAHTTADLEKWIASGREPDGSILLAGWELADSSVTARQNNLEPLRIALAPRAAFFAAISLLVLAAGLLLARLPSRAVGVLLLLMAAGAVVVGFLWPQPSGQVLSAAQPGLALLGMVLGTQRFLQWRYRRRLTRMPGFARIRVESAVARSNGKRAVHGASTVDSPAAL